MSVFTTYRVQSGDTLYAISRKFSMGVDEIKAINSLNTNNLSIGQTLKVRSSVGATTPTPAPQAQSTSTSTDFSQLPTYTVQPGDSLYRISSKVGMSVDELKSINGLTSNNLSIGQLLKVRSSGGGTVQTPIPTPPTSVPSGGNSNLTIYTVVAGDSLYRIATKFNMGVDELKMINGLSSNLLNIGQTLKVRSVGGINVPTPVPTPTPQPIPTPTPTPATPVSGNYMSARQQFPIQVRQDAGFNRYYLTVSLLNGGQVVANMRDNVTASRYMVYPHGIMYAGQSLIELDVATIESVGLNEKQAKALQYVSVHEGKFDAINSYDKAIFSYGFIQFAAAAAVGGSLNRLLSSMKAYAPIAFQRVFQNVGIDSEGNTTTVLTESGMKLRGDDAWFYIQRNVNLYGAFIQAGHDGAMVREQLRMANDLYVQPALNFKLDVVLGGLRITIPRLRDILSSEAAMTAVVALAVNQGVGGMSRIVANSVSAVAAQSGLTSQQTLAHINEQQVLQHIAATATDERIAERTNGVLRSDLSYAKA